MNPNIIYGLVDPRTLMVRYVGQSRFGLRRPKSHIRESYLRNSEHTHKTRWIRSMQKAGIQYEIVILQESSVDSIGADEMWWIAYGRACAWPLTNGTDGGEGGRLGYKETPEQTEKRAAKIRGLKRTDEQRERIRIAQLTKTYRPDEATRAKMSASRTGLKRPADAIEATAAFWRGHKHSAEALANMSAAQRKRFEAERRAGIVRRRSDEANGRISTGLKRYNARNRELGIVRELSDETREKLKTWTGRTHTDETREKMAAAARELWARRREQRNKKVGA